MSINDYDLLRFIHILGVILLLGNVTVSSIWKVFADRTRDPAIMAFSQRLITYTDWTLTLGGVLMIIVGGYGMVSVADVPLMQSTWLVAGPLLSWSRARSGS